MDVVWIARFGVYVFAFLLCRCLLEGARKKDVCGLNVLFMPMLLAMYAYAVGNMDVKSVDTLIKLFTIRFTPPFPYLSATPPSQVFCRDFANMSFAFSSGEFSFSVFFQTRPQHLGLEANKTCDSCLLTPVVSWKRLGRSALCTYINLETMSWVTSFPLAFWFPSHSPGRFSRSRPRPGLWQGQWRGPGEWPKLGSVVLHAWFYELLVILNVWSYEEVGFFGTIFPQTVVTLRGSYGRSKGRVRSGYALCAGGFVCVGMPF